MTMIPYGHDGGVVTNFMQLLRAFLGHLQVKEEGGEIFVYIVHFNNFLVFLLRRVFLHFQQPIMM